MLPTILDKILAAKRAELLEAKAAVPERELRRAAGQAPPARDFLAAIARPGPIKLIAEVKKASPSRGVIRADFDPVEIARVYASHGATCLSVLTDFPHFQGRLAYLSEIRRRVEVPLLRKDFIIDSYQLWEARAAGADAVLLIAECLDDERLRSLYEETRQLGMTPLVELYLPENAPRVVALGAQLIGVNNRDLRTFTVDLEHTVRMRAQLPAGRLVVAESGIRTRADVERLEQAGVSAMLVGESLMAQTDLGSAVARLLGRVAAG